MKLVWIALLSAALAFGQPGQGKGKGRGGRGAPVAEEPAGPQLPCDRACLIGVADTYLAALVAHDPSKAPMAANAKFVENAKAIKVGEGLWQTAASVPTTFKIYVPDPVSGQIGFIGVMKDTAPAGPRDLELALRLQVVNRQITQAEHLKAYPGAASLPNLQTPRAGLTTTIPAAQREKREDLLWAAAGYYDALDNSMGSLAPFADDCIRRENGMQTNGVAREGATGQNLVGTMKCGAQLDTHFFYYIDVINNRRVNIADPETGLAIGFSHFRHPMNVKKFKIYGVPGFTERDMSTQRAFDMPAAHIFAIRGGKIHEIEAVGISVDSASPTGWE